MKKYFHIKLPVKLTLYLLLIIFFSIFIIKFIKTEDVKFLAKKVIREIKIIELGKSSYIESRKKKEHAESDISINNVMHIETSLLPLKLESFSLSSSFTFPAGAGSIVNVEGSLLILDRFGELYKFKNNHLERLNLHVPNNLDEYILHSKSMCLGIDSMRAHSLSYDSISEKIYVSYEVFDYPDNHRFVISSIKIDKKTLKKTGDWETIFSTTKLNSPCSTHSGGGKLLVSGRKLFFTVGFSDDELVDGREKPNSQDIDSPFGKIYEYDLTSLQLKMKSLGHRNSQGLVVLQDGSLLNIEQGPQGGDELNLIKDGHNYGWPFQTYGTNYGSYKWGLTDSDAIKSFTGPVFSFVPSISASSVNQISKFNKVWNGDLLVGSLKSQSLFRIKYTDGRVIFSEPIWIGRRIRDIVNLDNKIVLLTDDASLIFITVDDQKLNINSKFAGYNFEPKLNVCLKCHHFEQTTPFHLAPSLGNIFNRKVASDNFSHYSTGLKKINDTWTKDNLSKFITNPNSFAPGTTMPNLNLSITDVNDIVEVLTK